MLVTVILNKLLLPTKGRKKKKRTVWTRETIVADFKSRVLHGLSFTGREL